MVFVKAPYRHRSPSNVFAWQRAPEVRRRTSSNGTTRPRLHQREERTLTIVEQILNDVQVTTETGVVAGRTSHVVPNE